MGGASFQLITLTTLCAMALVIPCCGAGAVQHDSGWRTHFSCFARLPVTDGIGPAQERGACSFPATQTVDVEWVRM